MGNIRKLGALLAFVVTISAPALLAPAAGAAPVTSVFDGKIPCSVQPNGVRACTGTGGPFANTVRTWDGTPIDVNVALPSEATFGPPPYPLAMYFHGFGGGKEGVNGDLKRFTSLGMAAFSMTERGFKDSCGKAAAIAALEAAPPAGYGPGACDAGFIHLMDTRYEVRDAQYLAGKLVDQGLVTPDRIGSVGASYGGGKSMALAALRNRIMLPDGSLAPWTSPLGTPMSLAAAAPIVPWTDFAYALVPNGRTLDYVTDAPYTGPFGVMKSGLISALLPAGDNFSGDSVPSPGPPAEVANPDFDILGWKALMEQGEPYAAKPLSQFVLDEMTRHHSSYYIDDSVRPAPLLIAQGFTDDLFPIDEALRFQNRTDATWPDADVSLLFADIGHPRAPLAGEFSQGREEDKELGFSRVEAFFTHYLLGTGPKPPEGVEVKTQKCPYTDPSGGPFTGESWPAMAPGELRLTDPTSRTIDPAAGSNLVAQGFSSIFEGCKQMAVTPEPGTLTYSFGTVPAGGYTLMGAPTVIADISVANGGDSQIAARLWEVSASNRQRLIARGVYRPDASGPQVFQLHGNAYRFEPGTTIQLQLLPRDADTSIPGLSYVRASNGQQAVTLSDVDIRLPVAEAPGSTPAVKAPSPKVLPAGATLAPDYQQIGAVSISQWANPVGALSLRGKLTARGRAARAKVVCAGNGPCGPATVEIRKGGSKGFVIATARGIKVAAGKAKTVSLKLTPRGLRLLRGRGAKSVKVAWSVRGTNSKGRTVLRRTGRIG